MIDLSLLQDFITEANEHLEEMETSLLRLEKAPDDKEIMNDIFRAIHTIKGASQFVGLARISELSHKMENLLDLLRQGEKEINQDIIDTLIDTRDRLINLNKELEVDQQEKSDIGDLLEQITKLSGEELEPAVSETSEEIPAEQDQEQESIPENAGDDELASALEEALNTSILDEDLAGETSELDTSILGSDLDTSILDDFSGEKDSGQSDDDFPDLASSSEPLADELIKGELAGEEQDKELFEIFLKQTAKNLKEIGNIIEQLGDHESVGGNLERCKDFLDNLRSSANYMDYTNLAGRYDGWLSEVESAIAELGRGESPSLAFMSENLDRIRRIMPSPSEDESDISEKESETVSEKTAPIEKIDVEAIRGEVSEELYDDELFEIFLKQLSENIASMNQAQSGFEKNQDLPGLIDRCRTSIAKLKSSANYMGYSNLVDLYDQWLNEINSGESDDCPGTIREYLEVINRLFPNLPEIERQEEGASLFQEKEAEAAGESSEQNITDEENDLFEVLSGSVEDAMTGVNQSGIEPLQGILEEMLFGDEPDENVKETAIEQPPQEAVSDKEPVVSETLKKSTTEKKIAVDETTSAEEERRHQERRQTERRKQERREGGERTYKQSIRVDSDKIDSLMNQVGELVVSRAYFAQIFNYLKELQQTLKEESGFDAKGLKPIREIAFKLGEATVGLGRVSNELQEGVMKVRMLPVAQLFNRYPRLVRDLIHKTGKKVDLIVRGEETELDKMVIEEISDPLIHIIRNAVDHGLESPEERKKAGKPETGTLILEAYHESNHIVIEITDDGRGIDIEKVKQKALAKGLISSQEMSRITDAEARRFIMMPGFSTADTPTETSGRGVGMDVIKTNIEKLNGTVEVDSQLGVQTRIRIKIPLTLAIIQALMVRVGDELFTIPLSVVEETLRIFEHDTSTIEGVEVIHMRDTTMPIFRLAEIFGIEGASQDISQSFVVIVTTGMQEIGLVVDELIGQEEVVIKPLVDYLREESGFSGATIIGDGRISLILDIYELVKMTSEKQIERTRKQALNRKGKTKTIKSRSSSNGRLATERTGSETIH